jgi:hypothetical protein
MECTVASQEHVGEIYLFETTVWWSIWVDDEVEIGTRVSASALKRPVRGVTARQHKKVYENRSVTKFDQHVTSYFHLVLFVKFKLRVIIFILTCFLPGKGLGWVV